MYVFRVNMLTPCEVISAFIKVFFKAKSIRKVVVPCGCNTAELLNLTLKEMKKIKF